MRKITATKRNLVDLEGCQVVSQKSYRRVLYERRIMALCLLSCLFTIALYITAVATSNWAYVDVTSSEQNKTTHIELGVWGEQISDFSADGKQISSVWISHFPLPEDRPRLNQRSKIKDQELPHYYRSQASFCIIALLLMGLNIFVGLCSWKHHRYMYKRLAAGLMFITAMCVLVTIQVLIHSIEEWNSFTNAAHVDYESGLTHGFSIHLAWITAGVYMISAVVFLIGGRKHKGERAATQEFEVQDRPVNLSKLL